jgi:autotransporter passenger strand-loop-strand repeat protein
MAVITTVVDVGPGQSSNGDVVVSPGEFVVSGGGTISSTVVADGGITSITDSGTASGTTLQDGGFQEVDGGGMIATAIATLVASGGEEDVSSGGVTSGATVSSGGIETIATSGLAEGMSVNGGSASIFSGGITSGTLVNDGGVLTVFSGGLDSGAFVGSGGIVNVSSGGTDSGASVTRGTLNVDSGGMAETTSVGASNGGNGTLNVSSGGSASDVAVGSGGTLNVSAGGVVSALITNDPKDQSVTAQATILSGGTVDGDVKIDGGMLVLDAGAIFDPNATLTISHTGELVLEQDTIDGTNFPNMIRDFSGSDFMDLSQIRFVGQGPDPTTATWTQTRPDSGILEVAHGAHSIDLHLTGTYTTANFGLQSDGVHGTTVTHIP